MTGQVHADPSVVLVPGLGLDARAWVWVLARLPAQASIALLPSLGGNSARFTDFQVERQADRLREQLVESCAEAVVLVGHSASCAVAVAAAARSKVIVGLVLVGPVTDPRSRTWPRMLSQWFRTAAHERLREVPVLFPQYWRTGAVSMLRSMNVVRWYRTDLALAGLDIPFVVVRGAQDRIAQQDWSLHLAAMGRGRVETVVGAGHMVPLTHPDAVVLAVQEVTAALRGRGAHPKTS